MPARPREPIPGYDAPAGFVVAGTEHDPFPPAVTVEPEPEFRYVSPLLETVRYDEDDVGGEREPEPKPETRMTTPDEYEPPDDTEVVGLAPRPRIRTVEELARLPAAKARPAAKPSPPVVVDEDVPPEDRLPDPDPDELPAADYDPDSEDDVGPPSPAPLAGPGDEYEAYRRELEESLRVHRRDDAPPVETDDAVEDRLRAELAAALATLRVLETEGVTGEPAYRALLTDGEEYSPVLSVVLALGENGDVGQETVDRLYAAAKADFLVRPELYHRAYGEWLPPELAALAPRRETARAASAPPPALLLTSLVGLRATPTHWLVRGRIPRGCITTIAGFGGDGKSTLTRHVTACLTSGRPAFGQTYETPPPPMDVILIAEEDGYESVVVPHLAAEGADLARVHRLAVPGGGTPTALDFTARDLPRLLETLRLHPDVRAIIIDPIASYSARSGINPNKEDEMRSILDPLARLAADTGVAVILIAHYAKGAADRAANRVAGSAALVNASRMVFAVERDAEDDSRRIVMPLKYNLLGVEQKAATFRLAPLTEEKKAELRRHDALAELADADYAQIVTHLSLVEFGTDLEVRPDDLGKKKKEPTRVEACAAWLRGALAESARPTAEIDAESRDAGFTFDNLKLAKQSLKGEGLASRKIAGTWWCGLGDCWGCRDGHATPETTTTTTTTSPASTTSPTSTTSSPLLPSPPLGGEGRRKRERRRK